MDYDDYALHLVFPSATANGSSAPVPQYYNADHGKNDHRVNGDHCRLHLAPSQ
jgi:hypothetical protein